MSKFQYRIQTTSMNEISKWRDLDDEIPGLWDYRTSRNKIVFFETREKLVFEPGYFRYAGPGAVDNISAHWHNTDPGEEYERVNVSVAE